MCPAVNLLNLSAVVLDSHVASVRSLHDVREMNVHRLVMSVLTHVSTPETFDRIR
jgi:hypothetical protein